MQVAEAASRAIEQARSGNGPTFLVANTYRLSGHYVGDAEVYRDSEDVEMQKAADPIRRCEANLTGAGQANKESLEAVWSAAADEVQQAVEFAEDGAYPPPESALDFVFTDSEEAL